MTRSVDTAPLAASSSLAAEAPVRRARLGTGRSRGAPVLFEAAPNRRALLIGLFATAAAPALPAAERPVTRAVPGPTLSRVTAEGDAWLAYRRALLREICDALQIDYATFTRDYSEAATACLRQRFAAAQFHSSIASAGARQGLPTAIIKSGAAS